MRLLRNPSLLTLLLPLSWTHGATSTPTSFQPHVFDLVARQGAQGQGAALSSNSSSDSGSTDASNTTASPRMANLSPIGLGDGSGTGQPVAADDFIRVSSNKRYLVNSSSSPYYLTGLNYWACLNLAADDDYGGNQTRFLTEMDQMAAVGVNHLRIMASSEGSPTPQKFRMLPALMPAPYQWDEKIFVGLDRCIAEAGKRGMRLTMTLANTWQWSGGMGQYISWLEENNGTIPYPSSWDLSAPPQRTDGHPGWGNYTASTPDGYTVFLRYTNRFFNSTKSQDLFHAHIDQVLNRNNTLTGVLYKDDPTILAWEAANEPQVSVDAPTTNGDFNVTLLPDDPMLAWLNQTADYVKARAPKQLFTTGAEAKQGHDYFHAMHSSENIDYATSHMWVQNWGVYNDTDNNVTNLHSAMDFARTYLYNTQSWAQELGKPILLEEFGMARDNWQNVEAGRYIYHENATTTNKDTYFEMVMSTVVQYFIQGQGYFGTMPWAYGGIYRPSNQTLSSKGILFAGDPQHEGPGWYDVYSTDNVMGNIHDQQKNVSFYLNVGRA